MPSMRVPLRGSNITSNYKILAMQPDKRSCRERGTHRDAHTHSLVVAFAGAVRRRVMCSVSLAEDLILKPRWEHNDAFLVLIRLQKRDALLIAARPGGERGQQKGESCDEQHIGSEALTAYSILMRNGVIRRSNL